MVSRCGRAAPLMWVCVAPCRAGLRGCWLLPAVGGLGSCGPRWAATHDAAGPRWRGAPSAWGCGAHAAADSQGWLLAAAVASGGVLRPAGGAACPRSPGACLRSACRFPVGPQRRARPYPFRPCGIRSAPAACGWPPGGLPVGRGWRVGPCAFGWGLEEAGRQRPGAGARRRPWRWCEAWWWPEVAGTPRRGSGRFSRGRWGIRLCGARGVVRARIAVRSRLARATREGTASAVG